jgi:hypothetical protein
MTKEIRDKIEVLKTCLRANVDPVALANITMELCDLCHEDQEDDECPLTIAIEEIATEEAADLIRQSELLRQAKSIINKS